MSQDSFKDIRSSDEDRKSIRNISRHSHISFSRPGVIPGSTREKKTKRRSGLAIWALVILVIFFLFFAFSILFSGAKILAYPKIDQAPISGEFIAKKQAGPGELQYEIMTISREGSKEVTATGEAYVEEKATGMITIYNNYSEEPQELIATTRFETSDGKIFRIPEGVIVPGQTVVGSTKTPGSITVRVIADQAGPEYNIAPTRFTIPGFKGRPHYEGFYAESKEVMTGGFKGQMKTVSETDKSSAYTQIQTELTQELQKDALSQKPESFVLFQDGIFTSFEHLPHEEAEEGKVSVKMKGTLQALIFDKEKLSGYLASQVLADYNGDLVKIDKLEDFSFTLVNKQEFSQNQSSDVRFKLEGNAQFIWSFDTEKLSSDLVGKSKRDIDAVLSSYPGIDRAEVVLRPFWRRSFPDEVQEIKLEVITDTLP